MRKQHIIAGVVLGLTSLTPLAAMAQTQEDCTNAVVELTELIRDRANQTGNNDSGRLDNARNDNRQAQSALDRGDYARCMELVNNAMETMGN